MTFAFGLIAAGVVLALAGVNNHTILDVLRGVAGPEPGGPGVSGFLTPHEPVMVDMRTAQLGGSGGYVFPFTGSATWGRIDQGVDFGGVGPIYAIGNAHILAIGAPGWPGGGGVLYKLLDGPRRGQVVFVYEGIRPSVRAGQTVRAGDKIGTLIPGSSTGIEIGWADASGVPLSHSEYTEGKETQAGKDMYRFLKSLQRSHG